MKCYDKFPSWLYYIVYITTLYMYNIYCFIYIHTHIYTGFSADSDAKESACSARDPCLILGWGDTLEKGIGTHSSMLT